MKTEELQYRGAKILIGIMDEELDSLKSQLSNFEVYVEEYQNIHLEKRKKEFLAARILLNQLLKCEVQVLYDEHQKPHLKDQSAQISITHSRNYVSVIAHKSYFVGIDLELRTKKISNIAERFLNERELSYFQDDVSKMEIAWSAKEALYKIIGRKAGDFAESFEILPFQLNDSGDLFVLYTYGSRIYTLRYFQNGIYTLAIVVDKKLKL